MEKTRKSSNITDVNALGMHEFHISEIEKGLNYPFPTLRLFGHRGYPDYVVYIRFIETVYISCAPSFDHGYIWRMATKEEAERMFILADNDRAKVYCIEEDISGNVPPLFPPLQRESRKFFIVAWGVEATLEYTEVYEDGVVAWGQPV